MRLRADKFEIGMAEIAIPGQMVSEGHILSQNSSITAVSAMPFPHSVTELRRYLGIANFMREYIEGYAMVAHPLSSQVNNLMSTWPTAEMHDAFDKPRSDISLRGQKPTIRITKHSSCELF